jgi:septum site-determining protein MinC
MALQGLKAPVTVAAARTRPQSIRFRGRSFMALVLAPEAPVGAWLEKLDAWLERSPGFFGGRAVILDLSGLTPAREEIAALIADLHTRDVRIMAVEGADESLLGLGLPPAISAGRESVGLMEAPPKRAAPAAAPVAVPPKSAPEQPNALLLDSPVRSGQAVLHPKGDVIVVGSVASGAEIVAGGSIHVYGTLRGRAIAGSTGNSKARIFCRKFEAELVAIDGLYKTADDVDPEFRGRALQAWLDQDAIVMTALD